MNDDEGGNIMAKAQKKSNREVRKPKAEKAKKTNASNPSLKTGIVPGLENMKR
jgi:hypothetical protein